MSNINHGSLQNHLLSNSNSVQPEVGMGATQISWSDRRPYTIVEVVSPKEIKVQQDNYKRIDGLGMSECQDYEFSPNPEAGITTLVLKKSSRRPNGRWVQKGDGINGVNFLLGYRDCYFDFSY
jgi:hypothetical protein